MTQPDDSPALSVICPAHNEQDNLCPLVQEIVGVLDPLRMKYEIIVVDDGSTDQTPDVLRRLLREFPPLRSIRMLHTPSGRGHGQSAAFHAGVRHSRGSLIALMDADLQNDPADIPRMLDVMREMNADLVQGDRSHCRRDTIVRRCSSSVGWMFRRWLLGDTVRDTGCSLRIMKREVALSLPLEFRGMHRFIPVNACRMGYKVVEVKVNHRPRVAGKAKYGIMNRALPGLVDCLAVRWMHNRRRLVQWEEISRLYD